MKNLFAITFLVLISSLAASAQTAQASPCPIVSVTGPSEITKQNEPAIYAVSVTGDVEKSALTYKWSVSSGEIINGLGTTVIQAVQKEFGENFTATVEIGGLPAGCPNIASETAPMCKCLQPKQFDEYSISVSQLKKDTLDSLAIELQNDSNATAYIFEVFRQNTPQKLIKQKIQKTVNYLLKNKGINKDRIVIQASQRRENLTQIFIVPAGAEPPNIEDN